MNNDKTSPEIIKQIIDLKKNGMSYLEIANKFNSEGLKTLRGHTWSDQNVEKLYRKNVSKINKESAQEIQTVVVEIIPHDDDYYDLDKFKDLNLEDYENMIKEGLKSYVEIGAALYFIKKENLYDKTYSNFDNYCIDRWGFTQRHADRLIDAFHIVMEMIEFYKNIPIQSRPIGLLLLPETESQARELKALSPEKRFEILYEIKDNNLNLDAKTIKDKVLIEIKSKSTKDNELTLNTVSVSNPIDTNKLLNTPNVSAVPLDEKVISAKVNNDKQKQLLTDYQQIILKNLTKLTECNSVKEIKLIRSNIDNLFNELIKNYAKNK